MTPGPADGDARRPVRAPRSSDAARARAGLGSTPGAARSLAENPAGDLVAQREHVVFGGLEASLDPGGQRRRQAVEQFDAHLHGRHGLLLRLGFDALDLPPVFTLRRRDLLGGAPPRFFVGQCEAFGATDGKAVVVARMDVGSSFDRHRLRDDRSRASPCRTPAPTWP